MVASRVMNMKIEPAVAIEAVLRPFPLFPVLLLLLLLFPPPPLLPLPLPLPLGAIFTMKKVPPIGRPRPAC